LQHGYLSLLQLKYEERRNAGGLRNESVTIHTRMVAQFVVLERELVGRD
jgi:hypothetical protein